METIHNIIKDQGPRPDTDKDDITSDDVAEWLADIGEAVVDYVMTLTPPEEPKPMNLKPVILDALDLTADNATPGNVAAHAWRLAHGRDGMEGINLGWRDMEASTSFLTNIVSDVDNIISDFECEPCGGTGGNNAECEPCSATGIDTSATNIDQRISELTDGSVTPYNAERMTILREIDQYGSLEIDPDGLMFDPRSSSYSEAAGYTLYSIASEIAYALAREIGIV